MFQTTLHAQPQYRVVVDPPVTVRNAANALENRQITLCFRERNNLSLDLDYCPLGQLTLQANADGPPQILNLGPGADNLNPEYPASNPRIGLLITATRIGVSNTALLAPLHGHTVITKSWNIN